MFHEKSSIQFSKCHLYFSYEFLRTLCKNTKPCEFTDIKNKELLALFLQQTEEHKNMLKCQKPKNTQSLD